MDKDRFYIDIALRALKKAANKVAENARKENRPVPIWLEGRVQYQIPPKNINQPGSRDPIS